MHGNILILGKDGQLGRALVAQAGARAIACGRKDIDLADPDFIAGLDKRFGQMPLFALINAAAYTQVDKGEVEDKALAFRINAQAVKELAEWCKKRDLPLVHFSTDYVFDGSGNKPRREDDATKPVNVYGESKLAGEQAIPLAGGRYLIFRTSWVYDAWGRNFFNAILRLLNEKETFGVVSDQIGAPTYAPHLAQAALTALGHALSMAVFPSGLYHLCNAGETSWHRFAQAIFTLARSHDSGQESRVKCQHINPIPTSAYPLPARRPLNSRLDCTKAGKVLGVTMPHWEEGVKKCFEEKYARPGLSDTRLKADHT